MWALHHTGPLFTLRIKARTQAIYRHRKMQRGHSLSMIIQIVQRAGQRFKNFHEWSCRCLHADAPS